MDRRWVTRGALVAAVVILLGAAVYVFGQFRPYGDEAIDRSQPVSPVLERRYRADSPGTCSTNVVREQLFRSQKYLRTRSWTMTRREPNGRSSRVR